VPSSYIPVEVERRVHKAARNRCGYCLSPQHLLMTPLEIDHIIPTAKGGTDDESNLWLACSVCNRRESDKTTGVDLHTGEKLKLFNPRTQQWFEHFQWSADGSLVIGLTPVGRVTVAALHLSDNKRVIRVRRLWVSVGWHPPKD